MTGIGRCPTCRPSSRRSRSSHARDVVGSIYIDDKIKDYIVDLVCATRDPRRLRHAATSSRSSTTALAPRDLALALAARAHAFLAGRGYVTPEDVKTSAADVLRHRVILTYEAEAEDVTSDDIIRRILDFTAVP